MSSFRQCLEEDVASAFLDPEEFGQEIEWNGNTVTAVICDRHSGLDSASGNGFARGGGLGLLEHERTIYLADTLPRRPVPEERIDMDGEAWMVAPDSGSVRVEMGMLRVVLIRPYA